MANRYRVCGHTTVTVTIEVTADTEAEAYEVALNNLNTLQSYLGNGGDDKLIGVDGTNETVATDEQIEYDDIELLGPAIEDDDDEDWEDDDDDNWEDDE